MKNLKKIIFGFIIAFTSWFLVHTLFILVEGFNDDVRPVDVAVVLGNEVTSDGKPSERLKARLDRAIEIFNNGQALRFIVSGGIGKEGVDEAKVMAQYLNDHLVPKENIIIDSEGRSTEKTVQNTLKIMKENNFDSVVVISQYFHISRIKLAFRKKGITEIYSAHPNYFELRDIYSIFREFFAHYSYALR